MTFGWATFMAQNKGDNPPARWIGFAMMPPSLVSHNVPEVHPLEFLICRCFFGLN